MKLAAKSKHDANGSLSYWKLFVCVFMTAVWFKIISRTHHVIGNYLFVFLSAVWFKIISRIDIFMNVIQTRQATFDTGVANIQERPKN